MIVDPDFLDHWRTRMLIDSLGGDELAPVYVLRVWAHCQARRATRFDAMSSSGLKALCRYAGDASKLESALIDAGFIVRDGTAIDIPKWAEHNAKLISNWSNGTKGGRPNKTEEEPNGNPNETQHNPSITQTEPTLTQAEPIREDKIREEKRVEQRATRLPADWTPVGGYIEFCATTRPDLNPFAVGDRFRDFWTAQPGAKGRKLDWLATWRNWIRNERPPHADAANSGDPIFVAILAKYGKCIKLPNGKYAANGRTFDREGRAEVVL